MTDATGSGSRGTLPVAPTERVRVPGTGENDHERLARPESPASHGEPHIGKDAATYIDSRVVFRQYYCPGCYTAFHTEVVPEGHVALRHRQLTQEALELHGHGG